MDKSEILNFEILKEFLSKINFTIEKKNTEDFFILDNQKMNTGFLVNLNNIELDLNLGFVIRFEFEKCQIIQNNKNSITIISKKESSQGISVEFLKIIEIEQ